MRRPLAIAFLASFFGVIVTGCQNDSIHTYSIPKEAPPAMPPAMGMDMTAPAADAKELRWTTPKGWKEQAPSAMRLGSFLIRGENSQTADMSVVPLSGEAGGDLANINRWRGQINLGPMTAADFSAQSETIKPGGLRMTYIDFVSRDRLINNRYKKRLMAAIYHRGDRTWFFKIIGEDATVLSAKAAFLQFLRSLRFHEN